MNQAKKVNTIKFTL